MNLNMYINININMYINIYIYTTSRAAGPQGGRPALKPGCRTTVQVHGRQPQKVSLVARKYTVSVADSQKCRHFSGRSGERTGRWADTVRQGPSVRAQWREATG